MTTTKMPTTRLPEPIAEAVATLDARRADLVGLEAAVRAARAGLDAARAEDRAAYALAMDQARKDPGPKALERARAHLEDVERRRDGEQLRVQRAEAALRDALDEHRNAWAAEVERAQHELDAAAFEARAELERVELERAQVRSARTWLRSGKGRAMTVPSPLKRNQNGDVFTAPELVAGLREAIAASTLAAELERDARREHGEQAAQQRREARRQGLLA
jgi:hypothetical protein